MNEALATYPVLFDGSARGGCAAAFALALARRKRKRAAVSLPGVSAGRTVAVPDERRVLYPEVRMRVEAGFVNHPKFLRLKKAVGDFAMEAIIRVWGHCEFGQKGEFWRGADAEFLEAVACWVGEPGKLFAALRDTKLILIQPGGIRVKDWNHHNCRTVSNWELGRRPKVNQGQASDKPRLNQGEAKDKPGTSRMYVSKYVSKDDHSLEENKNGASSPDAVAASSAEELKTQYAALTSLIEKMEPRRNDLTDEQLRELRELKKKRAAVQKLQAGCYPQGATI